MKSLQLTGQVTELEFEPLLVLWRSPLSPEGYSRRQSKVLTAKSMAELLGQRSALLRLVRQAVRL